MDGLGQAVVERAAEEQRLDELLVEARVRAEPDAAAGDAESGDLEIAPVLRLLAPDELAHELALGRAVRAEGVGADAGLAAAQEPRAGAALPAGVQVREVRDGDFTAVRA